MQIGPPTCGIGTTAGVTIGQTCMSLMRAARELGWRVPEDVAVLGAGDEDFLVEFESVPLSSVRLPARQVGHEAAALLDRLMTRGRRETKGVRLAGAEIVARRSSQGRGSPFNPP